jgi:hypothetical protein
MILTFSHMASGPNYARNATYTPRTIIDLELCNYKEKQAYFKNKYFWQW